MLLPTKIDKKSFYLLLSAFTISDLFGNWCESLALVEVTKRQTAFPNRLRKIYCWILHNNHEVTS